MTVDRSQLGVVSLAFLDPMHGWAATGAGALESTDGGETWTERLSITQGRSSSRVVPGLRAGVQFILFRNRNEGWAFGDAPGRKEDESGAGIVVTTKDAGQSWGTFQTEVQGPFVAGAFCNASLGFAVGPHDIVRTVDDGASWASNLRADADLSSIACSSATTAVAIGRGGTVLVTTNGGDSWQQHQLAEPQARLTRVYFGSRSDDWILGLRGQAYRSEDGGSTWQRMAVPSDADLFDIRITDREGWIVGSGGTIMHSSDTGRTWQKQASPTEVDLLTLGTSPLAAVCGPAVTD